MTSPGKLEHEVKLPGLGVAGGFGGPIDAKDVFYTFNSLTVPPTIFRYDIASQQSSVFRQPKVPSYDSTQYETKQVFYPSKDGTKIPMFIVHKKGLKLEANNPTLLYAYGGFNVVQSPTFSAARLAILEQGVVYVSANIRGGGEYGEQWHQQGMKLKKQNVFDDFIAAAEWLIANKYTSAPKLAIQGGSNGGLLVGAVMNQRPDLFGVAIPQVGVMDMLRFHKFTIGWNWIADYGSSDNPEEFKALYAYSPLHNIRKGVKYPATLITTADHDDRVVPAHSFKYAATLQELASGETPILIRIETKSGHGASSLTKALETTADIYSFMLTTWVSRRTRSTDDGPAAFHYEPHGIADPDRAELTTSALSASWLLNRRTISRSTSGLTCNVSGSTVVMWQRPRSESSRTIASPMCSSAPGQSRSLSPSTPPMTIFGRKRRMSRPKAATAPSVATSNGRMSKRSRPCHGSSQASAPAAPFTSARASVLSHGWPLICERPSASSVPRRPRSRDCRRDVRTPSGPLTRTIRSPGMPSGPITAVDNGSPASDFTG